MADRHLNELCSSTEWHPDTKLSTEMAREWQKHSQTQRQQKLEIDGAGFYEIKHGDSLWTIAERSMKTEGCKPTPDAIRERMKEITEANKDKLDCHGTLWLIPGQRLDMHIKEDPRCATGQTTDDGASNNKKPPQTSEHPVGKNEQHSMSGQSPKKEQHYMAEWTHDKKPHYYMTAPESHNYATKTPDLPHVTLVITDDKGRVITQKSQ